MGIFTRSKPFQEFEKSITHFEKHLVKAKNLEKELHKLEKIVNSFFNKAFGVNYRFTYEDVKVDLKDVNLSSDIREKTENICDTLSEFEFDKEKITIDKLQLIAMKLKAVMLLLQNSKVNKLSAVTESKEPELKKFDLQPEIIKDLKDEVVRAPEPEKIKLDKSPVETISIKQTTVKQLLGNLKRNKKEYEKEIKLIEHKKDLLKKEHALVKKEASLPSFKIFDRDVKDELHELTLKKQTLERKEKAVEKRINKLEIMEEKINGLTKQLKSDNTTVKRKADYIKKKETAIKEIKKDLDHGYENAMYEIEKMRKELEEKKQSFMELQKFYNSREKRLSLEETNLLNEKKNYSNLVSKLLTKQLELAKNNFIELDKQIKQLKTKDTNLDETIKRKKEKIKLLKDEKKLLEKNLSDKLNYFSNIEKELKKSDFSALNKILDDKNNRFIEIEKELSDYEQDLEDTRLQLKKKNHNLKLREEGLNSIEKDIENLKNEINNSEERINLKEQQLDRRISSFNRINEDIKKNISKEKSTVRRIESKLNKKGKKISKEVGKTEELDRFSEIKFKDKFAPKKIKEPDLPDQVVSHPNILEILQLLNKAKEFIKSDQKTKSRDVYLEIQRLFDELNEVDREEIYQEIISVFKTKNLDIDNLIVDLESSIQKKDPSIKQKYDLLKDKYATLPKQEKGKYYNRIMELHSQV